MFGREEEWTQERGTENADSMQREQKEKEKGISGIRWKELCNIDMQTSNQCS